MRFAVVLATALAVSFVATAASAQAPAGTVPPTKKGAFCLKESRGGATNCTFDSMAQCVKSKVGNGDTCGRNPKSRTTGSASSGNANSGMKK
ncbi:MAG: DUF3551 domain-containing protein [Pseudolabrys sp.]